MNIETIYELKRVFRVDETDDKKVDLINVLIIEYTNKKRTIIDLKHNENISKNNGNNIKMSKLLTKMIVFYQKV